jgi:hypothetical protein
MRTRGFTVLTAALVTIIYSAGPAAAQPASSAPARSAASAAQGAATTSTPTFEVSGGYQLLRVPDQTFPFGLNVDGVRHFGSLGLVGEIGFAHDSEEVGGGADDLSIQAWNIGVGGRWTGFGSGRVWPFAQVLVGAEVLRFSADIGGDDNSATETSFMLQPGVGVNFIVADGLGIVGQVDYRRTFFDEGDDAEDSVNNQFRVFFGLRLILD